MITGHPRCEVAAMEGNDYLLGISWTELESGTIVTRAVGNVFAMVGASPNTEWLQGCVEADERGFIYTGASLNRDTPASAFETSQPGLFAVGDVRAGSVKRVASGVGEGSVVVQAIHKYLHGNGH